MRTPAAAALLLLLLGAGARAEDPSGPRSVRFRGPDGSPVEGARVAAVPAPTEGIPVFDPAATPAATSGADGVATLPARAAGTVEVAWADGLAAAVVSGEEVLLVPASPLAGRVRLARGGPAADAEVVAAPEWAGSLAHRTRTDERGAYRFAHLAPGRWTVSLRRPDGRLQRLGTLPAGVESANLSAAPLARVEGRALDAQGASRPPVSGVRVRWVRLPDRSPGLPIATDAQGAFAFEPVEGGRYEVEVADAGWVFDTPAPRFEVASLESVRLAPLFLLRTRSVRGRVVDLDGKPVEGADLRLLTDPVATPPPSGYGPPRAGRSDAAGAFELHDVVPADRYRLLVSRPGFSPMVSADFDVPRDRDAEVLPVRLRPGWGVEVRAVDEGGRVVPGALVRAVPAVHPAAESDPAWEGFVRTGRTDADGRLVLGDLPEADAHLAASAEGRTSVEEVIPAPRSGNVRAWSPVLAALPALAGRVETSAGGPPATELVVRALPRGGGAPSETRTDVRGAFRFPHVRPVPTDLEVFAREGDRGLPTARVEAAVPGEEEVVVVLPLLAALRGTVAGIDPVGPEALVVLEAQRLDPDTDAWTWRTVATRRLDRREGTPAFAFEGVPPGPYALRAVQGARDSEAFALRVRGEDEDAIELEVPRGSRIAGTVLEEGGGPVLGALVRLVRMSGDGDAPEVPGRDLSRAADDDGAYVFEDVAPGLWRVEATDRDAAPDGEVVRVGEDESVVVRDLVLGPGGTIEGRAADATGRPLEWARIGVLGLAGRTERRTVRTGAGGLFRAEALPEGTWLVRLEGFAASLARVEVLADVVRGETTNVVLAPEGRGRIEGVVERQGVPAAGVVVQLLQEPFDPADTPRLYRAESDLTGAFAWDGLTEGDYVVGLLDAAIRTESRVHLRDGDRVQLDLEVYDGRIVGRVTTLEGEAVAGAVVRARPAEPAAASVEGRALTNPDGRFTLPGVPIGDYDLWVEAAGHAPAVLRRVRAETQGGERPVDVVLGRGATIDLAVLDPGRRGVRSARVGIESAEDGVPVSGVSWSTGPGGRLRLVGVPAGRVLLRVHARGLARPPPVPLELVDGDEVPVTVVLRPPGSLRVVLVGSDRRPVARGRIDLFRGEDLVESRRPRLRPDEPGDLPTVPRSGIAVFEDLEDAEYLVVVPDSGRYGPAAVPIRVRSGRETEVRVVVPRVR